jgi:hypothetical protein
LGAHQVCVEGDLVKIKWTSRLTGAEVRDLISILDRLIAEHSRIFVIADARHASRVDSEARAAAVHWPNYARIAGIAYIGASMTVRVIVTITLGARRLLGGALPGPTHFVDTEEQAYACIEARRRELMSRGPPGTA